MYLQSLEPFKWFPILSPFLEVRPFSPDILELKMDRVQNSLGMNIEYLGLISLQVFNFFGVQVDQENLSALGQVSEFFKFFP